MRYEIRETDPFFTGVIRTIVAPLNDLTIATQIANMHYVKDRTKGVLVIDLTTGESVHQRSCVLDALV